MRCRRQTTHRISSPQQRVHVLHAPRPAAPGAEPPWMVRLTSRKTPIGVGSVGLSARGLMRVCSTGRSDRLR
jgi:hypothetical protein